MAKKHQVENRNFIGDIKTKTRSILLHLNSRFRLLLVLLISAPQICHAIKRDKCTSPKRKRSAERKNLYYYCKTAFWSNLWKRLHLFLSAEFCSFWIHFLCDVTISECPHNLANFRTRNFIYSNFYMHCEIFMTLLCPEGTSHGEVCGVCTHFPNHIKVEYRIDR